MQHIFSLRNSIAPILLALSLSLFFGACNTLTSFFVSDQQEVALGFQVAEQLETEYTLLAVNDPVTLWAEGIVESMTEASADFRQPERFEGYKVHVIKDDALVNAFAAPGGFIYVTTGLILGASNCAEVAGVVGHEMAHVTQRHSAKSLAKNSATLGLSELLLNEGLPKDVLEGVYAFAMGTHFSRKDESEADRVGAEIMYHSGYNPYALADMFRFLGEQNPREGSKLATFFSSHPESEARAKAIEAQIEKSWDDVQPAPGGQYTYDCIGATPGTLDGVKALIQ